MIERLGFSQIGTQIDDIDGPEIIFERPGMPDPDFQVPSSPAMG